MRRHILHINRESYGETIIYWMLMVYDLTMELDLAGGWVGDWGGVVGKGVGGGGVEGTYHVPHCQ